MSLTSRSAFFSAGLGCCLLSSLPALAQDRTGPYALSTFEPTPAGDRFFVIQDASTGTKTSFNLGFSADYAREPLVAGIVEGDETTEIGSVVSDQLYVHMQAAMNLGQRLQLSLDFPVAVLNRGIDPPGFEDSPDSAALGDLRPGARLRLVGDRNGPFQAALTGYIWVPTGDRDQWTGEGEVRGEPGLALAGRAGPLVWGANVGVLLRPEVVYGARGVGDQITWGAGLALLSLGETLQIGPELFGTANLRGEEVETTPNLEAILGAKVRASRVVFGGGAGLGATEGPGTPAFRAFLSVAYAPLAVDRDGDGIDDDTDACPEVAGPANTDSRKNGCPMVDGDGDGIEDYVDACPAQAGPPNDSKSLNGCPDTDKDGLVDKVDACPTEAGPASTDPAKNGCPDRDKDGFVDSLDACPDVAGVASSDPKLNGCPAIKDKDEDGIVDDVDACPLVKGVASSDATKNGCPADTDGDGITDDKDACPRERGVADPDPSKNGCPTKVRVTKDRIEIMQQVQFKTASDIILPESDDLLTQVSGVMKEHPEIQKVEIGGHTDDRGNNAYNKKLSERRAASVRKWLTTRGGIEEARIASMGYGEEAPIAENTSDDGRQKNRRVEFKIISVDTSRIESVPGSPAPQGVAPPPAKAKP